MLLIYRIQARFKALTVVDRAGNRFGEKRIDVSIDEL
jgi:hypothetical protein